MDLMCIISHKTIFVITQPNTFCTKKRVAGNPVTRCVIDIYVGYSDHGTSLPLASKV